MKNETYTEDMKYEVTIGIPVYNVEKFIRLTMDAALAQTYDNIEFLVLDDCGTDSSMDIVRDYQQTHPRGKDIHIVRQPQNLRLGRARNRIIEEAQGRYLYFLDADDAIAPNTIELLYTNAQRYDADIVYGSYERIEEFGGKEKRTPFQYPRLVFLKEDEFATRVYSDYGFLQAQTWNFLIKREIYLKNNIRHKAVNFWEDFTTTIDLPNYITRAVLLPDITYFYYCRYGSLSNYSQRDHIDKAEIEMTMNAMEEVKQNSERFRSKPYFPMRMYKVMMTCFYVVCSALQNEKIISPPFTAKELRACMAYPIPLTAICSFRTCRIRHLLLYLLSVMPAPLFVRLVRMMGKRKGLI